MEEKLKDLGVIISDDLTISERKNMTFTSSDDGWLDLIVFQDENNTSDDTFQSTFILRIRILLYVHGST